jgi:two-component system chemotaxis response regulator CheY
MKLLIVDDSLVIRNRINRALANNFTSINRAEDGAQAVLLARSDAPDVITMDLTMPRMGGVACIRELVKIVPNARILVVSALADKEIAIRALSIGANGFLCKPFNEAQLEEAIRKVSDLVY